MHATRWESPEITRKEIAFSFERGGKWLIVSFFPFSLGNERALSWERISRFLFILLSIAWRISTPSGCTSVLSLVNEAKWNAEMGVYGWRAIRRAFNCNLADEIKLKLPGKCIPVCIRHRAIYIYICIYLPACTSSRITLQEEPSTWIIFDPAIERRFALKASDLWPRLIFNYVRSISTILSFLTMRHAAHRSTRDRYNVVSPIVKNKHSLRGSISDLIKLRDNKVIFFKRQKYIIYLLLIDGNNTIHRV